MCAGTKVYKSSGQVCNIEDLDKEDGILGYSGSLVTPQEINWFKQPEYKACYRITTKGNNTLECSYDHPLLTTDKTKVKYPDNKKTFVAGFTEAQDLKVGDYVFFADKVGNFGSKKVKHARLLGLLVGDGHYDTYISLCIDDPKVRNYVTSNYLTKVKKQFYTKADKVFSDLYIRGIKKVLSSNGMLGQTKLDKRLPKDIHTYSKDSLAEFLAGYFDADGNVYYNKKKNTTRVVLTSVVRELLEQVKYQLLKFGIHSSIYKEMRNTEPAVGYEGQHDYIYRLYISKDEDVARFKQFIPIISTKKVETLSKFTKGNRNYGRPNKVLFSYESSDKQRGKYYSDNSITEFTNLKFERVIEIEEIGFRQVYNLNCGPTHTYISNGFIHAQTGGDLDGPGGLDAQYMFYHPDQFDLLVFTDIYENQGQVATFLPAWYTNESFKDENGWLIDDQEAKQYYVDERKKLAQSGGDSLSLDNFIVYHPVVPSEVFLSKKGAYLPVVEIQNRIQKVRAENIEDYLAKRVELYFSPEETYGVGYRVDTEGKLQPVNEFP